MFACNGSIVTRGLKLPAIRAATYDIVNWLQVRVDKTHKALRLLHVLFPKKKLTVQIGQINSVEIQ